MFCHNFLVKRRKGNKKKNVVSFQTSAGGVGEVGRKKREM